MSSHIGPLLKPTAALPEGGDLDHVTVTDFRGLPIVDDWGLAATASAGAVRLEVDEALTDDALVATLVGAATQVRFRMRERGTVAEVARFLANGTASELALGWEAALARDPEFADRLFLRVG